MKSAEERAEEVVDSFGEWSNLRLREEFVAAIAVAFKEHARDQRHTCAEQVARIGGSVVDTPPGDVLVRAHSLAMNAPDPGKEK